VEERLAAFGLRVAPDKTALLCFNGDALLEKERPTRKPVTFVFLGYTHFLAKARSGILTIVLKPSVKARERVYQHCADLAQAEPTPARPRSARAPGQDAQRLPSVLRAAAVLHILIRRPSASPT
jgi:hypothetical protein